MFKTSRRIIGQVKINTALEAFERIDSDLQDGIEHLNAHVAEHRDIISDSEEAIDQALADIAKADRVSKRIKAITE